ncbi:ribosomal RNA small subunit methyltransferase E [Rhodobiaceae bacterium]|nr:ribosomal RNA small subunit methyltransferase E [Rhodobiaceae bacterium]
MNNKHDPQETPDQCGTGPDHCGTGKVRLFVEAGLGEGLGVVPNRDQIHYLLNVMRLSDGDHVRLFNGRDGEWLGRLDEVKKRSCLIALEKKTREQDVLPDIWLLFAPVKRARLDFMVQKAVEMGAGRLLPVNTARTNVARIKQDRLRANAVEAAEQCGLLSVPEVEEPQSLGALLNDWSADMGGRRIIFCDEAAPKASTLEQLQNLVGAGASAGPLAILIGPEGGFSPAEREQLLNRDDTHAISLGPRIMRADTAAVAALAAIQLVLGDWRD